MRMRVSRSRELCCAAILGSGSAEHVLDNLVGHVLATAALELAAHRGVSRFGVLAAARGGGANVAIPNHIAEQMIIVLTSAIATRSQFP